MRRKCCGNGFHPPGECVLGGSRISNRRSVNSFSSSVPCDSMQLRKGSGGRRHILKILSSIPCILSKNRIHPSNPKPTSTRVNGSSVG